MFILESQELTTIEESRLHAGLKEIVARDGYNSFLSI